MTVGGLCSFAVICFWVFLVFFFKLCEWLDREWLLLLECSPAQSHLFLSLAMFDTESTTFWLVPRNERLLWLLKLKLKIVVLVWLTGD